MIVSKLNSFNYFAVSNGTRNIACNSKIKFWNVYMFMNLYACT